MYGGFALLGHSLLVWTVCARRIDNLKFLRFLASFKAITVRPSWKKRFTYLFESLNLARSFILPQTTVRSAIHAAILNPYIVYHDRSNAPPPLLEARVDRAKPFKKCPKSRRRPAGFNFWQAPNLRRNFKRVTLQRDKEFIESIFY